MTVLTAPAQPMPLVDDQKRATVPWYQFFQSLSQNQGTIGSLLVNPGTGNASRTLNQVLADYANVNDYLSVGDTNYDGAIGRCLAARGRAYFPNKPFLGGTDYPTSTTIVLLNGQSLHGDGKNLSTIRCHTLGTPVVTLGQQIFGFEISDITLTHSPTATAGGDGLFQGQNLLDWVNDGVVRNVGFDGNYVGMNVGKAFFCRVIDCSFGQNVSRGCAMTSAGLSTVPSGSANGPLQWYFSGCSFGSNGNDGAAYISTATTPVSISVGAFTACTWFANVGKGLAAYGNANGGIYSVRVLGGFLGNDHDHEIYLDSYGNRHVIRPDFIELAGNPGGAGSATACAVYATANNAQVFISVPQINGCNAEGVLSQAVDTVIAPGIYTNNGLSLTASRRNAINLFGVAGEVIGVRATDTGAGSQQFGVASNTDGVQLIGCNLNGNISAPTALPAITGASTTQISGCLPLTINEIYTDQLHVYGAAAFVGAGGLTGTLGINVLAGGINLTTAIANNGIIADNIYMRISGSVGTPALGVAGQLLVAGDLRTVGTATTHLTASGGIALDAGVTIVSGGMNFLNTGSNGINAADDITIRRSLGVGGGASGTAGRIDAAAGGGLIVGAPTGGFIANAINLTGSYNVNGVAIVGFGGTYTGNVTITGDITSTGQIKSQDLWVTRSIGFTTTPSGTSGHFDGSPIAFTGASINMTGALAVTGATTLTGGASLGSDIGMGTHNITGATAITASGTITAATLNLLGATSGTASLSASNTGGTLNTGPVNTSGDTTTSTLHSGASAFTGGMTITSGGIAVTGGINVDNLAITGSLYNPAATGGPLGAGTINVAVGVSLNNTAYTNP
jgi:hypothetical protein